MRTVTTDDLERDLVLAQRIKLFTWVEEEHLDIPSGESVQGFYTFAQQGVFHPSYSSEALIIQILGSFEELLKINHYKAPRDKLICILNCCKVIFGTDARSSPLHSPLYWQRSGLIRHSHADEGADSFIPILIFVVLKANPEHLISNVEYGFLFPDGCVPSLTSTDI